jgi:N6-adenosine-specific RNA methylase IME4
MTPIKCAVCHRRFMPTRSDATTCSGRCRVARHRQIRAMTPPWPEGGPFDLVAVDLPLAWIGYSARGEAKSPQAHYATLDVPALIYLLRPMLKEVMAKDCVAAWWLFDPRLPDSLNILQKVGFTYKGALFSWRKDGAFGLGKTTRKRYEAVWYGSRGKGLPVRHHGIDQEILTEEDLPLMIEAPRQGHSTKPDVAYKLMEQLFGDVRRLELFARKRRPGWTVWGNEL